jgi:hypothetical protein
MIINLLAQHPEGQVTVGDLDLLSDDRDELDHIAAVDVVLTRQLF